MPKDNEGEIALDFEATEKNMDALKQKATEMRLDGEEKPFDIADVNKEENDEFLTSLGINEEKDEEEEEETEEEEVVEKKEVEEEKKELPTAEEKVKQDILNHFLGEDGKGSTVVKIKGQDFDLKDVPPAELKHWFEFGGGGYKGFENNAVRTKELDRKEEVLNRGADQVNQLMARYGGAEGKTETATLPKELEINDALDNDETKALKNVIGTLTTKISNLEGGLSKQASDVQSRELLSEIEVLKKEFPCVSPEQVIAMKAVAEMEGKNIPTRDIAEVCHRHYSGDEFFDSVLKARPEKERELKEKHIKEYLSKKGKAIKVGRSPSSSTASSKASSDKKAPTVSTFDEIEAQTPKLKKMLRELYAKGEEG